MTLLQRLIVKLLTRLGLVKPPPTTPGAFDPDRFRRLEDKARKNNHRTFYCD